MKIKEKIEEFKNIKQLKESNKILRKEVEELKLQPQKLIDKMTLMKIEIRELKLENKELRKELQNERNAGKEIVRRERECPSDDGSRC